jgi:hypothetical protein
LDDAQFSDVGGEVVSKLKQKISESNQQIYEKLSRLAVEQFLVTDRSAQNIKRIDYGPLEINDFSICFGITAIEEAGLKGIYVKIPKVDLYKKDNREIMPLTEEDRRFGEEEYQSLMYLSQLWRTEELDIRVVRPLGRLQEYNAIVTERVYAKDILHTFRRWDLFKRLRSDNQKDPLPNILFNLGVTLFSLHKNSMKEGTFKAEKTLLKIEHYCGQLKSFGIDSDFIDMILARIRMSKGYTASTQVTKTFKGLDIRNILIDGQGKIFILDPGKMKDDCKEADIARFVVTCRILYWGKVLFFLRLHPNVSYEESFVQGYYREQKKSANVLSILIIKELIKHWYLAHIALQLKGWPTPLKHFLKRTYIDPFYRKQISSEVANLEG